MNPKPLTVCPAVPACNNYIEFNGKWYLKERWTDETSIVMEIDEITGRRYDRKLRREADHTRTHRMRALITVRWNRRERNGTERYEPVWKYSLQYHSPSRRNSHRRQQEEWTSHIPCQMLSGSDDSTIDLQIQLLQEVYEYMGQIRMSEQVARLARVGTRTRFSPRVENRPRRQNTPPKDWKDKTREEKLEEVHVPKVATGVAQDKVIDESRLKTLSDGTLVIDESAITEDTTYDAEAQKRDAEDAALARIEEDRGIKAAMQAAIDEKAGEEPKKVDIVEKVVDALAPHGMTSEDRITKADAKWERKAMIRFKKEGISGKDLGAKIAEGLAERAKGRAERAETKTEGTTSFDLAASQERIAEQHATAVESAKTHCYSEGAKAYREEGRRNLGTSMFSKNKSKKVHGFSTAQKAEAFEEGWDFARDAEHARLTDKYTSKSGNPPKPNYNKGELHELLISRGVSSFNSKTKKGALVKILADYQANVSDEIDLRTGKRFTA